MEPEINLAPSFKVVSGGECYGGVLIAFFDQELLEGRDQQDYQQDRGQQSALQPFGGMAHDKTLETDDNGSQRGSRGNVPARFLLHCH